MSAALRGGSGMENDVRIFAEWELDGDRALQRQPARGERASAALIKLLKAQRGRFTPL